jgi:hypothetical protein
MSDRFQTGAFDARAPHLSHAFPPLPAWLARRLLRAGEKITWVRGPRFTPSWEQYATHPALFLVALALGAACVGAGWLISGAWSEMLVLATFAAGGIVLGSIFVLGISSGYFTRLVVTDVRLFIIQGYEVCRTWGIDDLPRSLIRFGRVGDGLGSRTVDLDALKTMLGGSSDKFTESKTILALGKQLDQIKARENGRR